jgi:hypothetical protein
MNWVTRNSFRNLFRQIFLRRRWKYCAPTSASRGPGYRSARNATAPAHPELEIHSFARSSGNGIRRSASLFLPHVLSESFVSLEGRRKYFPFLQGIRMILKIDFLY